jgi:DNA-binding transcriptional regulator YiaG
MSNLLDQWNEHIIRGNLLSRELEDIEDILEKSKGADICFSSGTNGSVFIKVLSPEKMQELRENVVIAIMKTRNEKTAELEKLMGIRKPATTNPEFEAAVQDMEKSTKVVQKPDPVEVIDDKPKKPIMTIEDVRRMYQDENMSMKDISEYYGVSKSVINNFIYMNKLARKKIKDDGYMDAQVEARMKQSGKERP